MKVKKRKCKRKKEWHNTETGRRRKKMEEKKSRKRQKGERKSGEELVEEFNFQTSHIREVHRETALFMSLTEMGDSSSIAHTDTHRTHPQTETQSQVGRQALTPEQANTMTGQANTLNVTETQARMTSPVFIVRTIRLLEHSRFCRVGTRTTTDIIV
ncbi:hypothetical protein ElyMa_001647000 [Elysia marginata]|uniref:Uncharacterized protein n=1 Tax=Elysia marginata TaxID=1093978 RepID=A0AAV4JLP8_9GAST|nr:hypothetical protein ElyMa_001647000 [Elysia marginata]